jgi:polyphenol oxidase
VLAGSFYPPAGGSGSVRAGRWFFSDRHAGVSSPPFDSLNVGDHVGDDPDSVESNRVRLAASLGLPRADLVFMDQVHSDAVATVDAASPVPPATDAIVTAASGVGLVVMVADCIPLLMADPDAGVAAAVHAGRKGVRAHIAARALQRMIELGADSDRVRAVLGPAICAACYEVPASMRDDVAAEVPAARGVSRSGGPALDLRAGVADELARLGVIAQIVGPCPAESPDLYSYRRDGATGRFAGVVWMDRE